MKAILITKPGGPEVLEWREVPEPTYGRDEVLVRVYATALNRADVLQRMGKYPAPRDVNPDIPGLEFAGVVEAVGDRVHDWKPGDRVMGLLSGGAYAEKIVTHARLLLPIPEDMSFDIAAAIPEAFMTAFDAVFLQMGLAMGEKLLIHAVASGVGSAALQLAREAGVYTYGTSRSGDKLMRMKELGLDVAIDSSKDDFAARVKEETNGRGVDAILDLVGAKFWTQNLNALAPKGRIVLVGMVGGTTAETNLALILGKRIRIMGTVLRSRPLEEKIALTQEFRRTVLPMFMDDRWVPMLPVVDRVYSIEEAADAHRSMEANENVGKIILRVKAESTPC